MPEKLKYYKMKFRLASPLAVGSGETIHTDSDIILDSRDCPVIPAAAFAGVIRHYLDIECNDKTEFFGYIDGEKSSESKIKFYDAISVSDSYITVRDSVALKSEEKVGEEGAKFDQQAVETNAEFITLFELSNADENQQKDFEEALSAMQAGFLRIGSKTSRGYGQIEITDLKKAEFLLPGDRKKWLDFSPYDFDSDAYYQPVILTETSSKFIKIHLELKQKGAVSIRSYTVKNKEDISSADYMQLATNDGVPVIPGTSWAGAFRQRFAEFLGNEQPFDKEFFNDVWGFVDDTSQTQDKEKQAQQKSKIYFSESRLSDGDSKIITRTSIDRFSAGIKSHALYTEKTYYHGSCELDIHIKDNVKDMQKCMQILSAVICDLDRGYLAVGGLTSVGRGLFTVEKFFVNEDDRTEVLKSGNIQAMTGGLTA